MSCEDNSSSCFWSVAAAGLVEIQCDFILQLHVFKLHTPYNYLYITTKISSSLGTALLSGGPPKGRCAGVVKHWSHKPYNYLVNMGGVEWGG